MSPSSAHAGEQNNAGLDQVYQFGANPFLIWNDELQDFSDRNGPQWQFDYSFIPQMPPQQASPQVLKDIANISDSKSPTTANFNTSHSAVCVTTTAAPVQPAAFNMAQGGLRIDNATTGPESARSKTPVPAIVTEPATRSNTVDESDLADHPTEGLQVTYPENTGYHLNMTPATASYQPEYMIGLCQSASALQDAFQFHSPVTRRNSVSSCNSGPVFSHYGTPISSYQHEPVIGTPYSYQQHMTPQSNSFNRLPQYSPRSPTASWKPQSRKYSTHSLSRMSQQYINALQKQRGASGISLTMPSRRKPRIEHSLSESSLFNNGNVGSRAADGRRRAASVVGQRSTNDGVSAQNTVQLQLPMFQPDRMFTSPVCSQSSFSTPDLNVYPMASQSNLNSPFAFPPYITSEPQQVKLTPSPTFNPLGCPSEPPASDFQDKPQAQMPIFQAPQFEGDIYTPQYKRRNAKGEWEGWCGLCQPGQWHNLKNSRYWDDKLRNHGICARTKRKFEDPKSLRIVNLEGNVIDVSQEMEEAGEMRGDEWVVSGLDGSLRKREGLCGYCGEWIAMDGVRSKGKGKSVGWWSHAYKCHEQGRKAIPSERHDNPAQLHSQYHPHPPSQTAVVPYFNLW